MNSTSDSFITRVDLLPDGVAMFGGSSPGCTGPLAASVTSMPHLGNQAFSLICGNAPPNSLGVVALAGAGLGMPVSALGVQVWVDPLRLWALPTVISNGLGAAELLLPVPQDPALVGGRIFAQFFWLGPGAPAPCPPLGLSASNGLQITILP